MSLWPWVRPGASGRDLLAERLERASDPPTLVALLAGDGVTLPFDPATLRIRQLALRTDRFVLLLEGTDAAGGPSRLIAKGYADDRAVRVDANHRRLWTAGLGDRAATVRTNEPLALAPSLGLALSEWLTGEHPAPSDVAGAERSGRAAARLHSAPAALEPAFDVAAFLDNLDRRVERLRKWIPGLRPDYRAVRAWLHATAREVAFDPSTPLNGDLSIGTFLLEDERVFLIDWDNACRFDAAWDVGHYVTQLIRFGLEAGEDSAASREAFLGAYTAERGDALGADWERRLAFFEAAACLHKTYAAANFARPGWEAVAAALVGRASAIASLGPARRRPPSHPTVFERRARRFGAAALGVDAGSVTLELLSANKPRRVVHRVSAGDRSVIAKAYPSRERARLAGVRLAAFAGVDGVVVPACLGLDVAERTLVMDVIGGTPLLEVFRGPEAEEAAERVGRAVGLIHRVPVSLPLRRTRAVAAPRQRSPLALDVDRDRIAAARSSARETMRTTPPVPFVPSHGDLGPGQVLVTADALAILDFDEAVMAEPALDLGNLLAQIVRRNGRRGLVLFDRLVRGYASVAPAPPAALVRAYALTILTRKLAKRPIEERQPLRDAVDLLLAEAAREAPAEVAAAAL